MRNVLRGHYEQGQYCIRETLTHLSHRFSLDALQLNILYAQFAVLFIRVPDFTFEQVAQLLVLVQFLLQLLALHRLCRDLHLLMYKKSPVETRLKRQKVEKTNIFLLVANKLAQCRQLQIDRCCGLFESFQFSC